MNNSAHAARTREVSGRDEGPSNVFILSPGRTGTLTFIRACSHIPGYTTGHETNATRTQATRLDYPDHHIEADNRLAFHVHRLVERYADRSVFVRMHRDRDQIARSYAERWHLSVSLPRNYSHGIRMLHKVAKADRLAACREAVEYVELQLDSALAEGARVFDFDFSSPASEFERFLRWTCLDDPSGYAVAEWNVRHNPNSRTVKSRLRRAVAKLQW